MRLLQIFITFVTNFTIIYWTSRIYLPLEELDKFGISDREVLMGMHVPTSWKRDDRWESLMRLRIVVVCYSMKNPF